MMRDIANDRQACSNLNYGFVIDNDGCIGHVDYTAIAEHIDWARIAIPYWIDRADAAEKRVADLDDQLQRIKQLFDIGYNVITRKSEAQP